MIIYFGTQLYFRTKKNQIHSFCGNCDEFAKLKSFNAINFFHFYYVPLIPLSRRLRHHRLCPKCKKSQSWDIADHANRTAIVKEQSADAIVALQNGDRTFIPTTDGQALAAEHQPEDCIAFLREAFEWLYAAGEGAFCFDLVDQLAGDRCLNAKQLLNAFACSMSGKLDLAIDSYQSAATSDPSSTKPLQQAAHLLVVQKRRAEAIGAYTAALKRTSDPAVRLPILVQMLPVLESNKQFAEAVATYEEIFVFSPTLAEDKAWQKAIQKAKKKAGIK